MAVPTGTLSAVLPANLSSDGLNGGLLVLRLAFKRSWALAVGSQVCRGNVEDAPFVDKACEQAWAYLVEEAH
jgi:hypothetical protein